MSLGDIQRRVLTTYAADTSEIEAGHGRVKSSSESMASGIVEGAKQANESINSLVETVVGLGLAFEGVKKISEFVWDGYKDGITDARNATAAAGVDIEKLTEASHGLVTEHDLLAIAAKGMSSAYKNSQEDLDNAAKAIVALERHNVSAAEAQDLVTTAITTGRTKGLEPYGVVIDKHIKDLQALGEENLTLAQKEEIHARALQGIAALGSQVVDGQDAQGESMQRQSVNLKNAWDELKKSVGQLAEGMQPLISALAAVVSKINDIINGAKGLGAGFGARVGTNKQVDIAYANWKELNGDREPTAEEMANIRAMGEHESGFNALTFSGPAPIRPSDSAGAAAGAPGFNYEAYAKDVKIWDEEKKKALEALKKQTEEFNKATGLEKILNKERDKAIRARDYSSVGSHVVGTDAVTGGHLSSLTLGSSASSLADDLRPASAKFDAAQSAQMTKDWQTQMAAYDKNKDTVLERTFGKVGDFDLYKEAFKSLEGAVGSSMKAWIDGSMSAGQAFKKFIGEAISGLASQMLIESLKHTAYSLGSLAFGDFSGAAKHAVAAAEFGAGAAAAAIAAKEMGAGASTSTSGSSASSGAAAGSGNIGSSGSGAAAPTGPIIVYGDSFSDDSTRMRQIKAQRMVNKALGTSYSSGR